MRELKFRAWDDDFKVMKLFDKFTCGENWINIPYYISNDTLMQYTGYKDKNGKDIYEKDIVRFNFLIDDNDLHLGQIVFDKGSFKISWDNTLFYFHGCLVEVIYNIYQEPVVKEDNK